MIPKPKLKSRFRAVQGVSHGAGFVVIFPDKWLRTVHPVNTGCFRVKLKLSIPAISEGSAGFHPLIRIGIHQPAMSVGRDIRIHVKIVGNGKVAAILRWFTITSAFCTELAPALLVNETLRP